MTEPGYFDRLYADQDDPWGLETSGYEQRKLGLLMTSLPREGYGNAFEPGCAIGVTTAALAGRCDRLTAMDCAPAAVHQARARLRAHSNVAVVQGCVPDTWPNETFDLIVLSELLYYLDDPARREVAERVVATLAPVGDLAVVHWRHPFAEAATTGDRVHAELADRLTPAGLKILTAHIEDDFRLEVFRAASDATHSEELDALSQGQLG
jgi:SAM-dependent methyltransferase